MEICSEQGIRFLKASLCFFWTVKYYYHYSNVSRYFQFMIPLNKVNIIQHHYILEHSSPSLLTITNTTLINGALSHEEWKRFLRSCNIIIASNNENINYLQFLTPLRINKQKGLFILVNTSQHTGVTNPNSSSVLALILTFTASCALKLYY